MMLFCSTDESSRCASADLDGPAQRALNPQFAGRPLVISSGIGESASFGCPCKGRRVRKVQKLSGWKARFTTFYEDASRWVFGAENSFQCIRVPTASFDGGAARHSDRR